MVKTLAKILFKVARQKYAKRLIGWFMTHMSFSLPVNKIKETRSLFAFHHPQPSYPLHILIVPKRPYASLMEVPPEDTVLLSDLFTVVQELVREFHLEDSGYRLITNGGSYQDVPHLHFHLVSDRLKQTAAPEQNT